jgi:hypothetical protein
MCSKPVSTTNLDPELELFCQECGKNLTELDCGFDDNINPKKGMERRDRDDEEEWGRIPIPQSDDSDDEPWLDESRSTESGQEEEDVTFDTPAMGKGKFSQNALMVVNNPMHVNKESTEDFAFRNGPRRDGIIRKKDGSLIIIDDPLYSMTLQTTKGRPKEEGEIPENDPTLPRWSPLLMRIQRQTLKMKYKARTKIRAN